MANNLAKAQHWRDFILARCRYPSIEKLRIQFANATLQDFCPCGCNSFAVVHKDGALPPPFAEVTGRGGMVFEATFFLPDNKALEILLFANKTGRLSFVEIDYCANSYAVPEDLQLGSEPSAIYASDKLLL